MSQNKGREDGRLATHWRGMLMQWDQVPLELLRPIQTYSLDSGGKMSSDEKKVKCRSRITIGNLL